jgi:hypothetical protein
VKQPFQQFQQRNNMYQPRYNQPGPSHNYIKNIAEGNTVSMRSNSNRQNLQNGIINSKYKSPYELDHCHDNPPENCCEHNTPTYEELLEEVKMLRTSDENIRSCTFLGQGHNTPPNSR